MTPVEVEEVEYVPLAPKLGELSEKLLQTIKEGQKSARRFDHFDINNEF